MMFKKFHRKNTKQNKTYTVDKKFTPTQQSTDDDISDELLFAILDDYMM